MKTVSFILITSILGLVQGFSQDTYGLKDHSPVLYRTVRSMEQQTERMRQDSERQYDRMRQDRMHYEQMQELRRQTEAIRNR